MKKLDDMSKTEEIYLDNDLSEDDYYTEEQKIQFQKIRILNIIGEGMQWDTWTGSEISDLKHLTGYETNSVTLFGSKIETLNNLWEKYKNRYDKDEIRVENSEVLELINNENTLFIKSLEDQSKIIAILPTPEEVNLLLDYKYVLLDSKNLNNHSNVWKISYISACNICGCDIKKVLSHTAVESMIENEGHNIKLIQDLEKNDYYFDINIRKYTCKVNIENKIYMVRYWDRTLVDSKGKPSAELQKMRGSYLNCKQFLEMIKSNKDDIRISLYDFEPLYTFVITDN